MCIIFDYLWHVLGVTRQASATQRFQRVSTATPAELHADFSRIVPIAERVDQVDLPIVPHAREDA
jgi:hypothetical protein